VALKKENEFLENCLKERNNEEINENINFEKELLQTKVIFLFLIKNNFCF